MQSLYTTLRYNTALDLTGHAVALKNIFTMEFYKGIIGKWPLNVNFPIINSFVNYPL